MLSLQQNNDNVPRRPTRIESPNKLISGWTRLGSEDQVETIVQQLWQAGVTPGIEVYKSAMRTWRKVSDHEGIVRVLLDILRQSGEGHEHLRPSGTMLSNAVINLTTGKSGQQKQRHEIEKAQVLLEEMFLQSEKERRSHSATLVR